MSTERRVPLIAPAELVITWDPNNQSGPAGSGTGAAAFLTGLLARLKAPRTPLLETVGRIMRRSYRANFEAGGRPTAWAPLRPRTVAGKRGAIAAGKIPRRTPKGRIPRRLMQVNAITGAREYSPFTKLIASGTLRDSWCVKGARGNVTDVAETTDGGTILVGSQLTLDRTVSASKPVRPYHILTKRAKATRAKGQAITAKVPLARIHEEGAPLAHIPARPVAHRSDGSANVTEDDMNAIREATRDWAFGPGG